MRLIIIEIACLKKFTFQTNRNKAFRFLIGTTVILQVLFKLVTLSFSDLFAFACDIEICLK